MEAHDRAHTIELDRVSSKVHDSRQQNEPCHGVHDANRLFLDVLQYDLLDTRQHRLLMRSAHRPKWHRGGKCLAQTLRDSINAFCHTSTVRGVSALMLKVSCLRFSTETRRWVYLHNRFFGYVSTEAFPRRRGIAHLRPWGSQTHAAVFQPTPQSPEADSLPFYDGAEILFCCEGNESSISRSQSQTR